MGQNDFKETMSKRRKSLKLSQKDLAKQMGISRGKLQRIESGRGDVGETDNYLENIGVVKIMIPKEFLFT